MNIKIEFLKKAISEGRQVNIDNVCCICKNHTLFHGYIEKTENFINENNTFLRLLKGCKSVKFINKKVIKIEL